MKRIYKTGLIYLLLFTITLIISMCHFAQGIKEDAKNKKNELNIQDSIRLNDSTYIHKKVFAE